MDGKENKYVEREVGKWKDQKTGYSEEVVSLAGKHQHVRCSLQTL